MNPAKIISAKRDGQRIADADLQAFLAEYARGELPDYQMAAFAMAVFFQGMEPEETVTLTRLMRDSGTVMQWDGLEKPVVDKHSTGGIGDKISIPLAPMLAACGLAVPMISGEGLGPTGGTLDKLRSIPGFRTDLSISRLQEVVREVGCVITGASQEIAPVDRELYGLRDVTGTVPSIPLITASILSKKLSEGLASLVLDVKWGSGSFMKTIEQAEALARSLVDVSSRLGTPATALVTDMNQPLGCVGNVIEVDESIQILKNNVDVDTITLIVGLGAELLISTGIEPQHDKAIARLSETIRSGRAYEVFERMVHAQGGQLDAPRPKAREHTVLAREDGFIESVDAEAIGWLVIEMGGGRRRKGDTIDHSTGVEWLTKIGRRITREQPVASLYCPADDAERFEEMLHNAIVYSSKPVRIPELIVNRISSETETGR